MHAILITVIICMNIIGIFTISISNIIGIFIVQQNQPVRGLTPNPKRLTSN